MIDVVPFTVNNKQRQAYPWLAAQDVRHTSQIDPGRGKQSDLIHRSKIHRWDLDTLCDPTTGQPFSEIIDEPKRAEL